MHDDSLRGSDDGFVSVRVPVERTQNHAKVKGASKTKTIVEAVSGCRDCFSGYQNSPACVTYGIVSMFLSEFSNVFSFTSTESRLISNRNSDGNLIRNDIRCDDSIHDSPLNFNTRN
jgi:hypothetical protein